jgi:hypothetical protein
MERNLQVISQKAGIFEHGTCFNSNGSAPHKLPLAITIEITGQKGRTIRRMTRGMASAYPSLCAYARAMATGVL